MPPTIKCPDCDEETVEAIADSEWVVDDPTWVPKEAKGGIIVEIKEGVTGRYCVYCERMVSVSLVRSD